MVADSVDELIKELESLRIRQAQVHTRLQLARREGVENNRPPALQIGDCVRITNIVNRPRGWPPGNDGDQVGTITNITRTRFYLITDSGIHTWRAAQNIARLD